MSDWGQGTANNEISWGQGSVNNEIGWGSIYPASWSGETNIIGPTGPPISDSLIFSVKTDNTGTSATNQFTIPTIGTGYAYDIRTSDGQTINGNTGNQTITFPTAGTYDIEITGLFPQFRFANGGDKLKILDIKNFGIYGIGSTTQNVAFYGCDNMIISATDIGHFENVTDFYGTWYYCRKLTSFPLIDTSSATSLDTTWRTCSALTSFPLINTSNVIQFKDAWKGCNSLISFPILDTSNGTNFGGTWNNLAKLLEMPFLNLSKGVGSLSGTWQGCSKLTSFPAMDFSGFTSFNYCWSNSSLLQSFPLINSTKVTTFNFAWNNCPSLTTFPANAFDLNIASDYNGAFVATSLTQQSVDNILVSIDTSGKINGTLSVGGSAPSAIGITAKNNLISKGWTVTTT